MNPDVHRPLLEQAAERFGVSVSQLLPLKGGNYAQVYEWAEDGQHRVLKISPAEGEDDLQSAGAVLAWLAYLTAHGAPVVSPLCSRHGSLIESLEYDGQHYLVSASQKIAGVRAETLPPEQWNAALIEKLGRTIGRCHALAEGYTPPSPALTRPQWNRASNCFNPIGQLAAADTAILEKRAQVLQTIDSLPKDPGCYNLAHLDIHFANFIVDSESGSISLIDFDDCAYGWFIMDIAMLLFDALVVYQNEDRQLWGRHFLEALLNGYRMEKGFSDFWVAQLPAFLKLLELGVYMMVAPYYDPAESQDEWVNKFMPDRERRVRADVPYLN